MNTTTTTQDGSTTQEGTWIDINRITIPADVRVHTQEDIDSRAASMARDGQAQPILLSKEGDKLVLVYGNGRLESAKKLGWEKIRADVKEGLTENQKLMLTLVENEEREDASPFFTASLYKRLMDTKNLTQEQLAQELGKELKTVARYLSLTKLMPEVQKIGHACPIGLRQCLEVAKLTKVEDQLKVMEECATQDLSGKALESRVKQLLGKPVEAKVIKAGPAFQFHWKGRELHIKVRSFRPDEEQWNTYSLELDQASANYRAAFPAPEVKLEEVSQAA